MLIFRHLPSRFSQNTRTLCRLFTTEYQIRSLFCYHFLFLLLVFSSKVDDQISVSCWELSFFYTGLLLDLYQTWTHFMLADHHIGTFMFYFFYLYKLKKGRKSGQKGGKSRKATNLKSRAQYSQKWVLLNLIKSQKKLQKVATNLKSTMICGHNWLFGLPKPYHSHN